MEIRIPSCGETPHYLPELCFNREGDKVIIQVADGRNYEKARYEISAVKFNTLVDLLLTE